MTQHFASAVGVSLPHLRRYARALTGSQDAGDGLAAQTIEALIADPGAAEGLEPKIALFREFLQVWTRAGSPLGEAPSRIEARAEAHMARLTPLTREALLLHAIEGFLPQEIGSIMATTPETASDLIVKSIRKVHAGEIWLDSHTTAAVMRQFASPLDSAPSSAAGKSRERSPLSTREREIVALVAQGYKNKEMAEKMFISEQTVKNHLHNIFDKLGVSDRLELALYAIHKGLHLQQDGR